METHSIVIVHVFVSPNQNRTTESVSLSGKSCLKMTTTSQYNEKNYISTFPLNLCIF